jgi:hypothetical protein
MALGHPRQQRRQFALRTFRRRAGRKAGQRAVDELARHRAVVGLGRQPQPRAGVGKGESRRHHADDLARHVVDDQDAAEHVGRGGKTRAPFGLAEDHRIRPAAAILVRREAAAEQRLHLQQRQGGGADPRRAQMLGRLVVAPAPHVGADAAVPGHAVKLGGEVTIGAGERRRMRQRRALGVFQLQADQLLRIAVRQRYQQHPLQQRAQGADGGQAQRQGEHHGEGECRRAAQRAQGVDEGHGGVGSGGEGGGPAGAERAAG